MSKTIRDAYGEALIAVGRENETVMVLDADVSNSTKTAQFGKVFPDRFFNVGIAEANMVGIAAGLAATGYVPFANTFAVFITSIGLAPARLFGSYSELPIKIVGSYGGVSDAFDGPSHHAIEDIAIMRSLPNFEVYVASDPVQTKWIVQNAVREPKPMYLRMSREAFPAIYDEDTCFEKGKGAIVQDGADATIIACGLMVGNALEAAKLLAEESIYVRVVDMFCIKPIDEELILRCAEETSAIITAEEHTVFGGLGSAVCETLCKGGMQVPVSMVGINDTHTECGSYAQLQAKYGIDAKAIVAAVKRVYRPKKTQILS